MGDCTWDTELLRLQLPLASGAVAHTSAQTSSARGVNSTGRLGARVYAQAHHFDRR